MSAAQICLVAAAILGLNACASRGQTASVFAYGDQCIPRAAAYNHVRSVGDIAACTCRGT